MFELTDWERLRWAMKTSQLRVAAKQFDIPIDDVPNNTRQKERIATRIATCLGVDIPIKKRRKKLVRS